LSISPPNCFTPRVVERREPARLGPPRDKISGHRHTDTGDTAALHIPSLGLLIAGDAIYETHPFLVESDRAGRQAWLAAIGGLAAINPQAVVVGHGPLDSDCSVRRIDATRRAANYLAFVWHLPRSVQCFVSLPSPFGPPLLAPNNDFAGRVCL
jgi:glyoxylase-like metal-dependent hydrolase (beta-lactamase superfamily II)